MQALSIYNDDAEADDSDADGADASPHTAAAISEATASEVGSPEVVVHPSVANLLRGGPAVPASLEAQGGLSSSQQEGQAVSEPLSQETDYGAAFSPDALSAFVDTDALHVELADKNQQIAALQADLKKAKTILTEMKGRLDAGNQKRAALSKEVSDLRLLLQTKRIEEAKAAARTAAMQHAVDIVSKHDLAIEAQASHLRQMHEDLGRMRKASTAFLDKYKRQLDGSSVEKSRK